MGKDKDQTKQTTGSMPRGSSQVGTHGQTGSGQGSQSGKNDYQGQGSQGKGQGQYQGQGLNKDESMSQGQESWKQGDPTTSSQGAWNDRSQHDFQGGDRTDPAQPGGTSPLDKDQQPVNQNRPVQQNR